LVFRRLKKLVFVWNSANDSVTQSMLSLMYENGKIRPIETIPGIRRMMEG
jgi:hypothetical protein